MKKLIAAMLAILLLSATCCASELEMESDTEDVSESIFTDDAVPALAEELSISAPSAILMEKESGEIIFEKNADERMEPASVTKVMTILLIAEAIDSDVISMDDTVTVSAYAESMGGSQVFLEQGEQMTVHEMLKCIVVSSANDAAVAMAEHLCGTEEAFVSRMNQRAQELGMVNTHFGNCTGLLDDPEHFTTARDIAVMSRELMTHTWITEFTTIWTDTIRNGEFGLSNTNKLIRFYPGATGLKTGFTSSAGFCLSAAAMRDGVEYIAVVMHCATSAERFESAKTLLSYAFANYTTVPALPDEVLPPVPVTLGKSLSVQPVLADEKSVLVRKSDAKSVEKSVTLEQELTAPVSAGQKLGELTLTLNGEVIERTDIVSADEVPRLSWWEVYLKMLSILFFGTE